MKKKLTYLKCLAGLILFLQFGCSALINDTSNIINADYTYSPRTVQANRNKHSIELTWKSPLASVDSYEVQRSDNEITVTLIGGCQDGYTSSSAITSMGTIEQESGRIFYSLVDDTIEENNTYYYVIIAHYKSMTRIGCSFYTSRPN